MGMAMFSKSTFDGTCINPRKYKILRTETIGKFCILLIEYPDCNNYEGKKILVFKDTSIESIMNQGVIDPHFSSNKSYLSPIARFVPTDEGWQMAIEFTKIL